MIIEHHLYKITNKLSGKSYIGVTKELKRRFNAHINGGKSVVSSAIKKHGKENFSFDVLVIGDKDYIYSLEKSAIKNHDTKYPNGYNIANGGESGFNTLGVSPYNALIDEVIGIKILLSKDSNQTLSKELGISHTVVGDFRNGRSYKKLRETLIKELGISFDWETLKKEILYSARGKETNHPLSQLTEDLARQILKSPLSGIKLAKELGLPKTTVQNFRAGRTYKTLYKTLCEELSYNYEDFKRGIKYGT